MSRFPTPTTAHLVDREGAVHSTQTFYDRNPQRAVDSLNPNVHVATDGRYQYTLEEPGNDGYLVHIEKLFETA